MAGDRADRMAGVEVTRQPVQRVAGANGSGRPDQCQGGHDAPRVRDAHDMFARAQAAQAQSVLLARRFQATQRQAMENWQLIQDAWARVEQILASRMAARTEPDRLRYWAYARLQAQLASLPVIEQAKGIIMAKHGWPEDQAFDALRRASQRENVKVRDIAARIVARTQVRDRQS